MPATTDLEDTQPGSSPRYRRRAVLLSGAVAALSATALGAAAAEPAATAEPAASTQSRGGSGTGGLGRIDVHHHAVANRQWLVDQGLLPPSGGPPWANWTVTDALAIMDEIGVDASVLSGPAPAEFLAELTPERVAEVVRNGNESLAAVVRDRPARFGFFAVLPLNDPDLALTELAYALDTLHADGVSLNMHNAAGTYLGDPAFDTLFAELNRRHAVVFTHPFSLPGLTPNNATDFLVDYLADTARATVNMLLHGIFDRFPYIQMILPHGGGYFPYMAGRLPLGAELGYGTDAAATARAMRRIYVDSAMPVSPWATPTLLRTVGGDHMLFGTDYPAATADGARLNASVLDADPCLDTAARRRICRDNALRLLPGLAHRMGF